MTSKTSIHYQLWNYTPSLPGAVAATAIFGSLTVLHTYRLIRNRTLFCVPFIIGGIAEAIGYAARAIAHNNTTSTVPYAAQSLLLLLAPILFAASIYMILGRVVQRTGGEAFSLVHPQVMTRMFVAGDVLCFLIQGGGGGILSQAKKQSDVTNGERIILGGLILQIYIFGFFVAVAGVFHVRLEKSRAVEAREGHVQWRRWMAMLYVASACIAVRNTARVIEYAMGRDGWLLRHEWPLYIYDCALMAVTLLVCLLCYDPDIKPQAKPIDSDGVRMGLL